MKFYFRSCQKPRKGRPGYSHVVTSYQERSRCQNKLRRPHCGDRIHLFSLCVSKASKLRFYGISEEEEGGDCRMVLNSFLEQQCGVQIEGIEFLRAHRIGKTHDDGSPRAIIARFLRYSDREAAFSKAKSLKDSWYRIAADLPKEIVNRRKLRSNHRSWLMQEKRVRSLFSAALNRINCKSMDT